MTVRRIFFSTVSVCLLLSLPALSFAEETTDGLLPQLFVTDVSVQASEILTDKVQNVEISIVNKNSYTTTADFYVLLGIVDDAADYTQSFYAYATATLPIIKGGSVTKITLPIQIPSIKDKAKIKFQAQIFNTSGMPFGFEKSKSFTVINNTADKNIEVQKKDTISITSNSINQKEVSIQNLAVLDTQIDVDVIYNGKILTSADVFQRRRGTTLSRATTTLDIQTRVPGADVIFNIFTVKKGKDEVLISSETKTLSIGINKVLFKNIGSIEKKSAIKIQVQKDGYIIDEKVFYLDENSKGARTQTGILITVCILLVLIIFKTRLSNRKKMLCALLVAAGTFFVYKTVLAQSGDAYVQTVNQGYGIWGVHEMFSLLSNTAGTTFDPGSQIPVTISVRGSVSDFFEFSTHALTLKTNGVSSGKLESCITYDFDEPEHYVLWAQDVFNVMSGNQYNTGSVYKTFSNTGTGTWSGPVLLSGVGWDIAGPEDNLYFIRCTYSPTVQITAPTIPGRHKMELESLFGWVVYGGPTPYPVQGAYKRGEFYYYVRPAAPIVTKATTSCDDRIRLTWPSVIGSTGYNIYRSTSENGVYTLASTTIGLSYEDFPTSYNTTYYYKVTALQSTYSLESQSSNIVSGQRVLSSCNLDRCTNIDGTQTQASALFSAYDRDYFYNINTDELHYAPSAASYGAAGASPAACPVDMCANTEAVEDLMPPGQSWNAGSSDPYTRYSCTAPMEQICNCSGRTYVCSENGIEVSSVSNASQCALDASCSLSSGSGSVTFNFTATNVLGTITNADPDTQTIPTVGSGTLTTGVRTIGNTGDSQTDTATCSYDYTNAPPDPCPDPMNPACEVTCDPATDPNCPLNEEAPGINAFIATPIVEQGQYCIFSWVTQHMAACNLGEPSGSTSYGTSAGKNITKTLVCQSNESTPRTFTATKRCLVRPTVKPF